MQISRDADIKKAIASPKNLYFKAAGTYFSSDKIFQLNKRFTTYLFFKNVEGFK